LSTALPYRLISSNSKFLSLKNFEKITQAISRFLSRGSSFNFKEKKAIDVLYLKSHSESGFLN